MHVELLEHARRLANGSSVDSADARRAVSAAYYAAFHAFSHELAQNVPHVVADLAARQVDHRRLKNVCNDARANTLPEQVGGGKCPQILVELGDNLWRLADEREKADYVRAELFTGKRAIEAVRRAQVVFDRLTDARHHCPNELAQMLFATIMKGR